MATLVDRIKRLEREEADVRARIRANDPWRFSAYKSGHAYLAYVTASLATLRRRQQARLRELGAVSQQAPACGVWLRRPPATPSPPEPRERPGRLVHIGGVEYVSIWPLVDDPKAPPTALNREAGR